MADSVQVAFKIPNNFDHIMVQDAPLVHLIVALKQHYDNLHNKSYRNAFEQTLYDGICTTNIVPVYSQTMKFISDSTNLEKKDQNVMDTLISKLPHSISTWESHSFLSAEQGKIGAVCAAIDQRLKFINDRLFGRTFQKEINYDGNNSIWVLNTLVPFIEKLNELTNSMTYTIRNCLRKAQEAAREEMDLRRANNIQQKTFSSIKLSSARLFGSFYINGVQYVKALTPHGVMVVPMIYSHI